MQEPEISAYRKILVPFDGSAGASKALRRALTLANGEGVEVTAFSVDEHLPRYAPGMGEVGEEDVLKKRYFDDLRAKANAIAEETSHQIAVETASGHAAKLVVQRALDADVDLIIIGHSGHSGVWGTLLGSTTARVVDHAPCDVLIVR